LNRSHHETLAEGSHSQSRWRFRSPDPQKVRSLAAAIGCHPITASVLVNRGMTTPEAASAFLKPGFHQFPFASGLLDMEKAVERIHRAVHRQEHILVFGDYDADGVTATVVLTEFLRQAGARVSHYIPHRIQEGYGLKAFHIDAVIRPRHATLVVTVDCGSSSHEAILEAKRHGIDVIVTDHHRIPPPYPEAYAILNPDRESACNGFSHLAGVGVSFLLVLHLRKHFRDCGVWSHRPEPLLKPFCELVAIGTVADMVPMSPVNRVLVRTGLESIANGGNPGIRSLAGVCGIRMNGCLRTEDLAFRVSPRLNAAGRMNHADEAVHLLTCRNEAEARPIAEALSRLNSRRQDVEQAILSDIVEGIETGSRSLGPSSLVAWDGEWHPGVLGIVAAKLVQRFSRPSVLIQVADGMGKGSARSLPGVDLYAALCSCADLLSGFGGHAMAAGLTVPENNIEAFCNRFDGVVSEMAKETPETAGIDIEAEVSFDQIDERLLDELELFEPFGAGNPEPVFVARDVEIVNRRVLAERHLGMTLRQKGGNNHRPLQGVAFYVSNASSIPEKLDHLVFRLRWNFWNGRKSPQLMVESFSLR